MNSRGNPQSTQSTLIPPQNGLPSNSTAPGNILEGNIQGTAIDSTHSPSVPLYALPDKLTRQKVKSGENALQVAHNILPHHALLRKNFEAPYLTPINLPCIVTCLHVS